MKLYASWAKSCLSKVYVFKSINLLHALKQTLRSRGSPCVFFESRSLSTHGGRVLKIIHDKLLQL